MKKFFRILFFLLVLAGAGMLFFAGAVTFRVPNGKIGVISSKTGGISKKIVKNGEFLFCRDFLIPNNASLFVFEPKVLEISGEKSRALDDAEVCAKLVPDGADFAFSFSYKISANVKREFFPDLVEKNLAKIQAEADSYLQNRLDALVLAAEDFFQAQCSAGILQRRLELQDGGEAAKIAAKFADLEILQFSAKIEKSPDFALYAAAAEAHKKYVEAVKARLNATIAEKSDFSAADFYEIERATRWAQAIRENPEIKDFLNSEYCKNPPRLCSRK